MTKQERAKVFGLSKCRMRPATFDTRFTQSMLYLANQDPDKVLTAAQKWALDNIVYRYRRQLAGSHIEIPYHPPIEADYFAAAEARRRPAQQAKLF